MNELYKYLSNEYIVNGKHDDKYSCLEKRYSYIYSNETTRHAFFGFTIPKQTFYYYREEFPIKGLKKLKYKWRGIHLVIENSACAIIGLCTVTSFSIVFGVHAIVELVQHL